MASEIRVNKITHTAGVGTITTSAEGIVVAGIVTANNFTGSGANLTSLPAGQLTGTVADARLSTVSSSKLSGALPALDGSALTGVGLGTDGSANTSGIITATAFAPTEGQLSHRNLIINGAMVVAQRGSSSTSGGYQTVDRIEVGYSGLDENTTQAQVDVASGTTPYTLGFRKAYKITNGNQTSGAGASDIIDIKYSIEAQDIATCGWNYTSSSSNVTLQFWIKSSVAQNFFGHLISNDGTTQNYPFETGSLSADTWTKVTKTIPGNSNLQFDNDNGKGLEIRILPFAGTDRTASSATLNQWAAYSGSTRTPDNTSTWYTTNDSTLEITGLQLEVGSVATPFEHKSYQDEIMRCYRYHYAHKGMLWGITSAGDHLDLNITFPVPMRTAPSRTQVDTSLLFKNRLNQNNSTSASTYSYSGAVSPTGDFWVARPGSGDSWGTYYASNESRGIYWHAYEGTTSYSWSAEL